MKYRPLVVIVTGLLFIPGVGDTVFDDDAISIEVGAYYALEFDMGFFDSLDFEYQTKDGVRIDVLFMNETFYNIYSNAIELDLQTVIFFYPEHSKMNTTGGSISFRCYVPGAYFVVFDNTGMNSNGATPTGIAQASYSSDHWINQITLAKAVVIVAIVVAMIVTMIGVRRRYGKKVLEKNPTGAASIVIRRTIVRRTVVPG